MGEAIQILIRVALVSGIVLVCFFLFKHRIRASIESTDKSMDPVMFPEGGYSVDTSLEKITSLKSGDFVAYKVPRDPASVRIACVVGIEGSKVEVAATEVRANGTPMPKRFLTNGWIIPEIKVPRGCVFLLADNPYDAVDSKSVGPVPFVNIVGTVKPVH